jgi:hypothetical protein
VWIGVLAAGEQGRRPDVLGDIHSHRNTSEGASQSLQNTLEGAFVLDHVISLVPAVMLII